ncbi:MAG: Trp family transcriptional regulator [Candidatus Shapirobacteria bacterium]|nr:Trp family transcriptional regulator [Candidatus Shapirobacteria bacterium]
MRLSGKKLNPKVKQEIFAYLYQLIADIDSEKEAESFCRQIFSPAEQIALAKRLAILWALQKGQKYSQIRARFHISPATIAKLQNDLSKPEVKRIIQRLESEEWAAVWEKKIKNIFNLSS